MVLQCLQDKIWMTPFVPLPGLMYTVSLVYFMLQQYCTTCGFTHSHTHTFLPLMLLLVMFHLSEMLFFHNLIRSISFFKKKTTRNYFFFHLERPYRAHGFSIKLSMRSSPTYSDKLNHLFLCAISETCTSFIMYNALL